MNERKILILDPEANAPDSFGEMLSAEGYEVCVAGDPTSAAEMLDRQEFSALITDARVMLDNGTQFCEYVSENYPDLPVILLTGYRIDEHTLSTMLRKAFCHFRRPPDYLSLKGMVARAVEQRQLKQELESLRGRLGRESSRHRIIGNTLGMLRVLETIEAVKDSESNVLISGEAGSGKELIARTINNCGAKKGPFILFNCAAMPKELIESELFGSEKGFFVVGGARKTGKFEEASSGTLFLDEIGELELSLQAKLFGVIREKEIAHPDNGQVARYDFRLISSTKRDLKRDVKNGTFREDLFYRINQVEIAVPPLRDRKDDIPLLFSAFVNEFSIREKKVLAISEKLPKILENYSWPGNVRQLRNVAERAVILASADKITARELPEEIVSFNKSAMNGNALKTLREMEMDALRGALDAAKGNKSMACRILGISRKAMYRLLRERQI